MLFKSNDRINDQYRVENCFAGGMGVVYIAIDEVSKRRLAIKTLNERLSHDRISVQRFEREAHCWINLGKHDHIVNAITFYRGKPPLLLLEFIEGPTLGQLLKSEPAGLDRAEMVSLAVQISQGLAFAHSCPMPNGSVGVVHRDIKPANILLSKQGVPKLSDFGLVKSRNDTTLNTSVCGTRHYMSPEQGEDSHDVTERSDVYSLGVVLYEMITGIRPRRGHYIRMSQPDADNDLIQLVEGCLGHKAQDRPTSQELLSELQTLRDRVETDSTPCPQCSYRPRKQHLYCPICGVDRGLVNKGLWRCVCGRPNQQSFAFCLGCGKKRIQLCAGCGRANSESYGFCAWCGTKLAMSD